MFSVSTQVHFLSFTGSDYSKFLISALPPDAKLHNLLSLAVKTTGSNLILQHQKLMLEHFGHKHTGVLPEDVIQELLLGVSFLIAFVFLIFFLSVSGSQQLSLFDSSSNLFYFQSTHTLELALHLESKVISLKQDALKLMNIALVGTASSQILSLFEFTFSYPKSQESKDQAAQLEELERKFNTDDESPDEADTISKKKDEADTKAEFGESSGPKPKRRRFRKCKDDLRDLVPVNEATPITPTTTVTLSETGIPQSYYSSHQKSKG